MSLDGNNKKPYATIRDVARLSGLSTATVTRTFQGDPRVRPETQERVRLAASQLGYRPDFRARALVTGRSRTIGFLSPSLVQTYWGEIGESIDENAEKAGFGVSVSLSRLEPDREMRMIETFLSNRVEGVIVGGLSGNPEEWRIGDRTSPPVVVLEWESTPDWDLFNAAQSNSTSERLQMIAAQQLGGRWSAHLTHDDVEGGAVIARYLLDLGHKKIAFAAGPPVRTSLLRLLGIQTTLATAGLELEHVLTCGDSFEAGREAGLDVLARRPRPTAIVCYNDVVAIGVARAAREAGLSVPNDLSIVGHDDLDVASYVDPPLTTMRRELRGLGAMAVKVLLETRENGRQLPPIRLTGTLVERGSTARARR